MGVAIDTYDKESGIHPRNKQLTTKRLAVAGLNVAYGLTEVVYICSTLLQVAAGSRDLSQAEK